MPVASAANISHVLSRQLKAPREAAELLFYINAMSNRRFPPHWSVEELAARFVAERFLPMRGERTDGARHPTTRP
jgi:hypothetical protein